MSSKPKINESEWVEQYKIILKIPNQKKNIKWNFLWFRDPRVSDYQGCTYTAVKTISIDLGIKEV